MKSSPTKNLTMNDVLESAEAKPRRAEPPVAEAPVQSAPPVGMPGVDRIGNRVLGTFIDAVTPAAALDTIIGWARAREARTVCFVNVHSAVTAHDHPTVDAALAAADLCLPDGAPIAWRLRHGGGFPQQRRVSGPDIMEALLTRAQAEGLGVFFYGSAPGTLQALCDAVQRDHPGLSIRGSFSPPFRALTATEMAEHAEMINATGAGLVFIGLGCPKQEQWMAMQRGAIRGVCLGVGAAFDFLSGTCPRAPAWMRHSGLEWLHRLGTEPGRLARRYVETNLKFMIMTVGEWLTGSRGAR